MKILLILFFSLNFIKAQNQYEFNKEIIYQYKFNDKINESFIYINTADDTYYIKTYKYFENLFAILYDMKNHKKISFKLIEIPNSKKYDLQFQKSENFFPEKLMSNQKYDYDFTKNENYEQLKIFTNKKRKKTYKLFEYETTDSEENFFPAFRFSCIQPFEFNQTITSEKPILIKKSKIYYKKDICECNLKSINDYNFKLDITSNKNEIK